MDEIIVERENIMEKIRDLTLLTVNEDILVQSMFDNGNFNFLPK